MCCSTSFAHSREVVPEGGLSAACYVLAVLVSRQPVCVPPACVCVYVHHETRMLDRLTRQAIYAHRPARSHKLSSRIRFAFAPLFTFPHLQPRTGKDELPRLTCVLQHAPPCFVYAAVFQPAEVMDRIRGATVGEGSQKNIVRGESYALLLLRFCPNEQDAVLFEGGGFFDRVTSRVLVKISSQHFSRALFSLSFLHKSHPPLILLHNISLSFFHMVDFAHLVLCSVGSPPKLRGRRVRPCRHGRVRSASSAVGCDVRHRSSSRGKG